MPFDGKCVDERIARLEVLCELASTRHNRNQSTFRTCLWSEARRDVRLKALGIDRFRHQECVIDGLDDLPALYEAFNKTSVDLRKVCAFFGMSKAVGSTAFGKDDKKKKAECLRRVLDSLKKEVLDAV